MRGCPGPCGQPRECHMKILVCVKQVPEIEQALCTDESATRIVMDDPDAFRMNRYDAHAVEEAIANGKYDGKLEEWVVKSLAKFNVEGARFLRQDFPEYLERYCINFSFDEIII